MQNSNFEKCFAAKTGNRTEKGSDKYRLPNIEKYLTVNTGNPTEKCISDPDMRSCHRFMSGSNPDISVFCSSSIMVRGILITIIPNFKQLKLKF